MHISYIIHLHFDSAVYHYYKVHNADNTAYNMLNFRTFTKAHTKFQINQYKIKGIVRTKFSLYIHVYQLLLILTAMLHVA